MQSKGTVPLSSCGGGTNIPRATQPDCSCSVMLDVFCGADRGEWELSSSRGQCWPWTCCTVMVCWIMFCMVTCCLLRVQGRCPVLWAGPLARARKVPGLVGGPPCRSFGLRRHFVPGVQSALERDGAGRFGKVRLEASDERLVKREFTLFGTLLRHFWHLLDKTANQCAGRCCDPLFLF